jgi:aromatic ring-opening dioxygenase catalytic subunit (LigB family)
MDWTMGPASTWDAMSNWLSEVANTLPNEPQAILVVSAHWETPIISVTSAATPELIYDYYGFPEHTYQLRYDVPGSPALAKEVCELLAASGIEAAVDPERGLDHGVFVPLKMMFPEAGIPVVQVSLHHSLDPMLHIDIGAALGPLRERGVLIVGSGMSFHNMAKLMSGEREIEDSDEFDEWLSESCQMEAAARTARLCDWSNAPAGRSAHPREEHLLPLMVAAGAGSHNGGRRIFRDRVMGSTVAAFQFD